MKSGELYQLRPDLSEISWMPKRKQSIFIDIVIYENGKYTIKKETTGNTQMELKFNDIIFVLKPNIFVESAIFKDTFYNGNSVLYKNTLCYVEHTRKHLFKLLQGQK